jgi:hypothetical protein
MKFETNYFGESVECRRKARSRRRWRMVVEDGSIPKRWMGCGGGFGGVVCVGIVLVVGVGIVDVKLVGLIFILFIGGRIALNKRQTHCD